MSAYDTEKTPSRMEPVEKADPECIDYRLSRCMYDENLSSKFTTIVIHSPTHYVRNIITRNWVAQDRSARMFKTASVDRHTAT